MKLATKGRANSRIAELLDVIMNVCAITSFLVDLCEPLDSISLEICGRSMPSKPRTPGEFEVLLFNATC